MANLEKEGQAGLMDELAETFMFGDVPYVNLRGDRVDRQVRLSVKAEGVNQVWSNCINGKHGSLAAVNP